MTWLRIPLHDKEVLLELKSRDLFFPPHVDEAISQLRTIMNSNSLLHATEHASHWGSKGCHMVARCDVYYQ